MNKTLCFSLVLIACFLCVCDRARSANILYFSTVISPSHDIWDKTLAIALRDRGHHITYVTHFSEKSTENFTTIIFEDVYENIISQLNLENTVNTTTTEDIQMVFDWIRAPCPFDMKTQGFKTLLKLAESEKKFDLIIFDKSGGICFYPLVKLFGHPPLIGTSPFGIPPYLAESYAIDLHTSYVPHSSLRYTQHMNFIERLSNFYFQMYEIILKYYNWRKMKPMLDEFYRRDVGFIHEIEYNFSLMLPNYDPIFDYPRPLPPDVIPVGGLHIKRAKTLTQDLQEYLDNSKDGVIMFSFGTNIRSDKLKTEKRKIILETFSQLRQNIIWKFESNITDLPKNVKSGPFFPQNDILAHPNVKLLINHGGALSTQEAMYHGVPLLIVPFFLDQRLNTHKIVNRKLGLALNYENLTVDNMLSTIREVINNPIYSQNAKKLSKTFQDRPQHPLDRAVFWVEHVIRQKGAEHLRSPAREMSFFYIYLLDIWAFIVGVLFISYIIMKNIFYKLKSIERKKFKSS